MFQPLLATLRATERTAVSTVSATVPTVALSTMSAVATTVSITLSTVSVTVPTLSAMAATVRTTMWAVVDILSGDAGYLASGIQSKRQAEEVPASFLVDPGRCPC